MSKIKLIENDRHLVSGFLEDLLFSLNGNGGKNFCQWLDCI